MLRIRQRIRYRKLLQFWYENLTWTHIDASSYLLVMDLFEIVYDSPLSILICCQIFQHDVQRM